MIRRINISHITTIVNDTPISKEAKQAIIDYSFYALVSAAGLGFLSFVFSCIYFCMLTRKDSQIYTEVNKMGYSSLTHDIYKDLIYLLNKYYYNKK